MPLEVVRNQRLSSISVFQEHLDLGSFTGLFSVSSACKLSLGLSLGLSSAVTELDNICLETVRLECSGATELCDTWIVVRWGELLQLEISIWLIPSFVSSWSYLVFIILFLSQFSLLHHSVSVSSAFAYILHPRSLLIAIGIYVTILKTPFELWRDWRLHIFSFSSLTGLSQCFGHNRHSKKYVWKDLFYSFKRKYVMVW